MKAIGKTEPGTVQVELYCWVTDKGFKLVGVVRFKRPGIKITMFVEAEPLEIPAAKIKSRASSVILQNNRP